MKKGTRYVGLDVHAQSIAVAVAEADGEVRSLGVIPNSEDAIKRLLKKLGARKSLRVCYEAGPCGYALYWQLTKLNVSCVVVAPTLIPMKAGDRVKTDRRDAMKLARCHRAGDLTAVWVPDAEHEALRDLVRAREAAKKDQLRARHRLSKFLLRQGLRAPKGVRSWTAKYLAWAKHLRFDHTAQQMTHTDYFHEVEHASERIKRLEAAIDEAVKSAPEQIRAVVAGLQALRGVAKITAVTLATELGEVSRFDKPRQLMGYSGLVASEHSSGTRIRRHGITKTGNAHLRRVLVEAAWSYRHRPCRSHALRKRSEGLSEPIKETAWKAQHRLHGRYVRLVARGKNKQQVATAIGRELLGFIWAIGVMAENEAKSANNEAA